MDSQERNALIVMTLLCAAVFLIVPSAFCGFNASVLDLVDSITIHGVSVFFPGALGVLLVVSTVKFWRGELAGQQFLFIVIFVILLLIVAYEIKSGAPGKLLINEAVSKGSFF
ncbi:MAG: hypothetical protein O7D29_04885 [Gemmatimonadetes bacterium]|nr:hypothetical protein [Gemmatimonadota bacterium]